jgi:hypothetical protein
MQSFEQEQVTLPADLLGAIADLQAGRVALVEGAGCSVEAPTSLPVASQLSAETHRRLTEDHVEGAEDIVDPEDLSAVADAIYQRHHSQRPVVERFPYNQMANAAPNEGYQLAAALLADRALGTILTLNFDLAQKSALAMVGASGVTTVRGPEDHALAGVSSLIYLHRTIDSNPEELILRTAMIEREWREHWEDVIASKVLASAFVVFCGVGTSAAVLTETTKRIVDATQRGVGKVYVVGPSPAEESALFQALGLPADQYLQMTWGELVRALAARLVAEFVHRIRTACGELTQQNGWDEEDVTDPCEALRRLSLLELGQWRARCMLEEGTFAVYEQQTTRLLADLVIGIALLSRLTASSPGLLANGLVELEGNGRRVTVLFCSGGGVRRWAALEIAAVEACRRLEHHRPAPRRALVSGFTGPRDQVSAPQQLVPPGTEGDVVGAKVETEVMVFPLDDLRQDPAEILDLLGLE